MLIGEIVNKSGLSKDAIRFYEKRGLITVGRSSSPYNNYKEYSEEVLKRLLTIKGFKAAGFTIKEISNLLGLMDVNMASCNTVAQIVSEKFLDIDKNIKALKKIKQNLINGLKTSNPKCTPSITNKNCEALGLLEI